MEDLYFWIIELCVCSLAVAVSENLLPEGNVKKTVYFVLGIVVVTCFISPIESFELADLDIRYDTDLSSENTDWLNRMTDDVFKSNVEGLVRECLDDMKVKPKNIDIHTDINEDNCIFIDKVRITVAAEYSDRVDEIDETIYKNLGLDADVNVR